MITSEHIRCENFPCADMRHESYHVPGIDLQPEAVSIVLISECAPEKPGISGGLT